MPKGLPVVVKDNLEKCRSAAIAAVDVYNRRGPRFRAAHYIVLIGECQAALINLEALISSQFGSRYALTEQLAVALQFSGLVPTEKRKAAGKLASPAAQTVNSGR